MSQTTGQTCAVASDALASGTEQPYFRILCLDGGGCRAFVLLKMLEAVEQKTGMKVCAYCLCFISCKLVELCIPLDP